MSGARRWQAAVVGVRGMGLHQARLLQAMPEFALQAVCDLDESILRVAAEATGVRAYTDMHRMMAEIRPEVVAICTPNATHASLTVAAARGGAKAVMCEKPMAVDWAGAVLMTRACAEQGTLLVINHQRRVGADLRAARRLISAGVIGELKTLRGFCAGDMLTDGTHVLDSLLYLAGDAEVTEVAGELRRDLYEIHVPPSGRPGWRYGHPVESAARARITLAGGVKMEIDCGSFAQRRAYQEYEVVGSGGRLWRVGDGPGPNLFIDDGRGGEWEAVFDSGRWHDVPQPACAGHGRWRLVAVEEAPDPIAEAYRLLAASLSQGTPHPMGVENARRGFECLMAVYESARLGEAVRLPLRQDRFPLELMMAEGRA